MEPVGAEAIGAVLAGIASGASGELGAEALRSLRESIQRKIGRLPSDEAGQVNTLLDAHTPEATSQAARLLEEMARADREFELEIREWAQRNRHLGAGSVHNTVRGDVTGSVIQAGEVNVDSITVRD